jgi:chromosomal replication initiator protein
MQTVETPTYFSFPGFKVIKNETEEEKMERIISTIATYLKIDPSTSLVKTRKNEMVYFRQLAMFFIRNKTTLSLKQIGYRFSGKDHTTVLHACNTIADYLSIHDEKVYADFEHLKLLL